MSKIRYYFFYIINFFFPNLLIVDLALVTLSTSPILKRILILIIFRLFRLVTKLQGDKIHRGHNNISLVLYNVTVIRVNVRIRVTVKSRLSGPQWLLALWLSRTNHPDLELDPGYLNLVCEDLKCPDLRYPDSYFYYFYYAGAVPQNFD